MGSRCFRVLRKCNKLNFPMKENVCFQSNHHCLLLYLVVCIWETETLNMRQTTVSCNSQCSSEHLTVYHLSKVYNRKDKYMWQSVSFHRDT